ncbi:50S ribosomal protein L30 [Candidatus Woesearchaeota archaeon]|nr:MAG: 50S ribosomal protein L30 [Candidatus Woesearchaeota archaeon]
MEQKQKKNENAEKKQEAVKKEAAVKKAEKSESIAVIRIRGDIKVKSAIKDTLKMLNLHKKNSCVIVPNNASILGMIRKCKDYVTWGEVDESLFKGLKERKVKNEKMRVYCLHPPRGGFERKGIKKAFTKGGALGYRGKKINDLIKKMLP